MTATAAGVVLGTALYMSLEQARGLAVDARTDVWSLGVVLCEMVAARLPFAGRTTSDVIAAILERDYEPLSRLAADLPPELARIVGKALRKDPDQRYQVMKDLLLDLEALRVEMGREPAAAGVSVPTSDRTHRHRRWASRRPDIRDRCAPEIRSGLLHVVIRRRRELEGAISSRDYAAEWRHPFPHRVVAQLGERLN